MTVDSACGRCSAGVESAMHIVRDCCFARDVWHLWLNQGHTRGNFFSLPLKEWLVNNVTKNDIGVDNVYWRLNFIMTVWGLWKNRNNFIFQHKQESAYSVWLVAKKYAQEVMEIIRRRANVVIRDPVWVKWQPPNLGHVLLNTDGAVKLDSGLASAGGLLRNSSGDWINGFVLNIGITDSLNAELWGVREGLILAKQLNIPSLIVEMDAFIAVQFLKDGVDATHPCYTLVQDCRRLMQGNWIHEVRHILRQGNQCADRLASMAQNFAPGVHLLDEAPLDLLQLLLADKIGIMTLRS